MKKLSALLLIFCFMSADFAFAITETAAAGQKSTKLEKITKKDPGIIKLPSSKKIDEKAFQAKLAEDEKNYQRVRALAHDYNLYRDEKGRIRANISGKNLSKEENDIKEVQNSWIEGYYLFYKTADKLIRANDLDTQNWRFLIDKKTDELNAYADAANLVVINSSMADSFYDNEDALAHIIGHELSHHILGHGQKNKKAWDRIQKLDIGIENSINFMAATFGLTGLFALAYHIRQRVWFRRIRANETEADKESLTLMARAGYDTDYANDVWQVFAQEGEHEKYFRDTHPKINKRMEDINKQLAVLDIDSLQKEGRVNLYEKPVMKMKRSSDKKSIVLIPEKARGSVHYMPVTEQRKVINQAYTAYLKDDMNQSEKLFEEAYKMDKKNYVPCLYLSYINEYDYKVNKNQDDLKQAWKWAKRAYRNKNTDKNTVKQKLDVKSLKKAAKEKSWQVEEKVGKFKKKLTSLRKSWQV